MQRKKIASGETREWPVDLDAVGSTISWVRKDRKLLEKEIGEMEAKFPFFLLTFASQSNLSRGEIFCPNCGDLIIFSRGIRCVACDTTFSPYSDPLLGYVGQIPSLVGKVFGAGFGEKGARVSGRPFLKAIQDKLARMRDGKERSFIGSFFLTKATEGGQKVYFSPQVFAFFPDNWPRQMPRILMSRRYFREVLFPNSRFDYSDFHAFDRSGNLLELCIYAHWYTSTLRTVLEQRIVPKIIIDLMVADLAAVGKLEKTVGELGTSLHSLYNWMGRGRSSEKFKSVYDKYIKIN